jgi:hypothetical protein
LISQVFTARLVEWEIADDIKDAVEPSPFAIAVVLRGLKVEEEFVSSMDTAEIGVETSLAAFSGGVDRDVGPRAIVGLMDAGELVSEMGGEGILRDYEQMHIVHYSRPQVTDSLQDNR